MNIIRTLLKIFTGVVTLTVFSADLNAQPGGLQLVDVVRLDRRIDKLVPSNARLEKIAGGHKWVEGPVWNRQEGYLLFSDIPANAIFRWQEGNGVSLFLRPSGYSGAMQFAGTEPGSNGLAYDPAGRLVLAEHGDRRISRLDSNGRRTTLADRYHGKRINSPNDLVFKSNGDLYFTDPPFGLRRPSRIRARRRRFRECTNYLQTASSR